MILGKDSSEVRGAHQGAGREPSLQREPVSDPLVNDAAQLLGQRSAASIKANAAFAAELAARGFPVTMAVTVAPSARIVS